MEVTGTDAQDFLERVTVADVQNLPLGSCKWVPDTLDVITVSSYIAEVCWCGKIWAIVVSH